MGVMIFVIAAVQWLIIFGIAQLVFDHMDTIMKKCEGTWTLLCFTWHGFTIVGAGISPYLWTYLNGRMKAAPLWIVYTLICVVFAIIFTALSYLFYVHVLDGLLVRALGVVETHPFGNPGYYYAFGAANVPYTYYMMK